MSRDIRPLPSSATGSDFTIPFPDLAKPDDGAWKLAVTLQKTTAAPSDALIELLQQQTVLGSTTVSLTNSPVVYVVPLSSDTGSQTIDGRCHLTELYLHVQEKTCDCEDNCCEEVELPSELNCEFISSCPSQSGSGPIFQTGDKQWESGGTPRVAPVGRFGPTGVTK